MLLDYIKILLLVIISIGTVCVKSKTLSICKSCKIKQIKTAIKLSRSGDTIIINKGFYSEGLITIDKPISLIGKNNPVVDGGNQGHVFYIRSNNVSIKNLTIQNSGMSYVSDFSGIRIEQSKNCTFKNNKLINTTYAIYLSKVQGCNIEGNRIIGSAKAESSSGNGVHLFYSNSIKVKNNHIQGHRDGLYFEFAEDSFITYNNSHNNLRFGMHFMFSHNNTFNYNIFSDNPTGVAIMYSRNLKVHKNIFQRSQGNSSYGFLIKEITDSQFIENIFTQNTWGIFLNASNRNLFKKNTFQLNGWAAEVYSNSYDNKFIENNFLLNNFDVATNSRRNTSQFSSNYWDKYKGYDLNYDKKGDIPYRPVSIFSFWVSNFPELAILLNSPMTSFLEVAEHFFPAFTPGELKDTSPSMLVIKIKPLNNKINKF